MASLLPGCHLSRFARMQAEIARALQLILEDFADRFEELLGDRGRRAIA